MLAGGFRRVLDEQVRHRQRRKDADTQTARTGIWEKYVLATPARGGQWDPRFYPGVFVGMLNSSSEAVVVTEYGSAIKTRAAKVR